MFTALLLQVEFPFHSHLGRQFRVCVLAVIEVIVIASVFYASNANTDADSSPPEDT